MWKKCLCPKSSSSVAKERGGGEAFSLLRFVLRFTLLVSGPRLTTDGQEKYAIADYARSNSFKAPALALLQRIGPSHTDFWVR